MDVFDWLSVIAFVVSVVSAVHVSFIDGRVRASWTIWERVQTPVANRLKALEGSSNEYRERIGKLEEWEQASAGQADWSGHEADGGTS